MAIFSVFLIFAGGSFSNDAKEERIADYAANVAIQQSDGELFSINVGNKKSYTRMLPVDHELYNLYGIFKQEKITFASSINATKQDHNITIQGDEDINLSFLYVGPTGSIKYTRGHKKYLHYVFPVELMFEDNRGKAAEVSEYICYLSKSQATRLLNRKNNYSSSYDNYSEDDYKELLYSPLTITIDVDNQFTFSIINVYFEDNYYCTGLSHVMGDFVICSYYLPLNLRSEQKSMYFMSKYSYQNKYFMDYINDTYSGDDFEISINPYNIKGNFNDGFLLSFYKMPKNNNSWAFMFVFLAASVVLFGLFLAYKFKMKHILLYFTCSYIFSYLIFKIIFLISKNVIWFSSFSCRTFVLFYLIMFTLILVIKYIVIKRNESIKKLGKSGYEISI